MPSSNVPGVAVALLLVLKPSVKIAVDITAIAAMPPRQLRAMIAEADAIWTPHDVSLVWIVSETQNTFPEAQDRLTVVQELAPASNAPGDALHRRLGSAQFVDANVAPDRTLRMSIEGIARMVDETRLMDRPVREWPRAVRQELTGRALGRVLAHEIGHYLLAWRWHTSTGLMRKTFDSGSLIEVGRKRFALAAQLRPRLRTRLAQLTLGPTIVELR
jgi:hypothetical protein